MKRRIKTYVVFKGRKPGIYGTWAEAEREVMGYSGAVHRSYHDISLAESAFEAGDPNFGVEGGNRNDNSAIVEELNKCYAVFVGQKIGIFTKVEEADNQVNGYPDGFYEIYQSYSQAKLALEEFLLGPKVQSTVPDNSNLNMVK